ncbi:MAG: Glycosyl transferase, group 1 [Candidatus Uhrbacteria bacterium GW2011_GWA2_52_8d]|uniref:Glycosyl transferase, group 1 n=1 Tax=Candidatus Uhrbacteria bacterium GW2011_GWA2_52_8d TaxID=1618979 RepID=A0A0G1XLU6_9BACT|nr:MAG: Glycosyl transferase, group 1 [Candidatus Uhrbacteria bacterium GW2011_GWA2_52_8d]
MHIGIDARFYGPFGKGLGRYVQKLIEHLERIPADHRFTIFLRKENWDVYTPHDERFVKCLADFPWYSVREQTHFPRLLRAQQCDRVHFPHYNVPVLYRRPFLVTIHDLIVSRYPTVRASTLNPIVYRAKHLAYQFVIRSAIQRARAILTVSEYSKRILQETYRISSDRITVTYEAAEPLTREIPKMLDNRFRSLAPYLLYVGNAYPHKNLDGLVRAFALLRTKTAQPIRLVLVGKIDYFYERVRALVNDLSLSDVVIFPGYVTDEELASLYRYALLYVFPSFEEGFGLPPLEAMQAGVPVASSDRSCLPEVLGDAAAYFDPGSPETIAHALHEVLTNDARRADLLQRGYKRVARFRWDDLARKTLAVYTES